MIQEPDYASEELIEYDGVLLWPMGRTSGPDTAFFKALRSKAYPKPSAKASRGKPIYAEGRQVGVYYPDSWSFVTRRKDKHLLQKPRAICVDKYVLLTLRERGCAFIRAQLIEQSRTPEADAQDFMDSGLLVDCGHGEQYGLELHYWREVGGRDYATATVQGVLFGGLSR